MSRRGFQGPKWDPKIVVIGQVVPDEFADALRLMRSQKDPRLSPTLLLSIEEGWTATALGNALGVTREAVLARAASAAESKARAWGVDIPAPPRKAEPEPRPAPPEVSPKIAARLRALHAEARTVNGGTPADDPRRGASVELSALLAELVAEGFAVKYLARLMGVTYGAVRFRLSRHGYKPPSPSTAKDAYKGAPTVHVRRSECMKGHPLTAENTYSAGRYRTCRTCARARSRASYLRRQGQVAA